MGRRSPSPAWKTFDASARKSFHSVLCHLLHTEFPGIFGPAITKLFADKIDELYARFHPPASRFRVGQVLGRLSPWTAYRVETSGSKTPGLSRSFSIWSQPRTSMRRRPQVRAGRPGQQDRPPLHTGSCSGRGPQSGRRSVNASHEPKLHLKGDLGARARRRRHRPASRHCPRHGPVGHPQGHYLLQATGRTEAHQPGRGGDVSQPRRSRILCSML